MKSTIALCCLLVIAGSISAQNFNRRARRAPSLSFGLQAGDPLGAYNQNIEGQPFGLAGAFLVNNGQSPIEFGVQASWQQLGGADKDVLLPISETADGEVIVQDATLQVNSNAYGYHGLIRLKPFARGFQIYGDLMAGLRQHTLRSKLQENHQDIRETVEGQRDYQHFTSSYGWAAGVKVRLSRNLMLEGRFENLHGGTGSYVDPDNILINTDGTYEFEVSETSIRTWNYQLGLSIEF